MGLKIAQIDAFTAQPFRGNPAAVCVLDAPGDPAWMQNVAAEMNLAETAFLYRQDDGFNLRWFTPVAEVDLCGHATLASSHYLWQEGYLAAGQQARFYTRSGLLTADQQGDSIEMDFPARAVETVELPAVIAQALEVTLVYTGKNNSDYLIEVASEEILRSLKPDFGLLGTAPVRGTIVTSRSSDPAFDFVSRFFAPAMGINEDPVTGSAHCALTPYWAAKLGKTEMVGYQASRRGGVVRVRLNGDRVGLGGQAVTVLKGELV